MKFRTIKNTARPLMLLCTMALGISSCNKDFGDINKAWDNKTYDATIPATYNYIASTMQDAGGIGTIYTSFLYQSTQLAAQYAQSGYRLDNSVGGSWDSYYYALSNYYKVMDLIAASPDSTKMTNVKAMLKTLLAYKALKTTTLFGDMPYSEAGKVFYGSTNFRPAYDPQASIFSSALEDLKWAIDNFSTSSDQVSLGASETVFHGDIAKWIKFANSSRLRYALVMHDKDATTADAVIAEALTKPLLEAGDNYGFYPANLPNAVYDRRGMYTGNSYVRMGSTMFHAMSSTDAVDGSGIYDLRTKIFFEPNSDGDWIPYPMNPGTTTPPETGGNAGGIVNDPYDESRLTAWVVNGVYKFAPLNFYYVADKTFPQLFITSAEVDFLKAEIYNRGIGGVTANPAMAKQYYEEGIAESVKFWYGLANGSAIWQVNKPAAAPTTGELNTMLTNPAVAYSATPADALKQIYKQSWIAFFHQPLEAWNLQRRTGGATPAETLSPSSPVLNFNKLIYPTSETESNYDNWKAVTGGANDEKVKPWFMP
jgi:hypothetical protein